MVINATAEFYEAKKKFDEAKTPEEKLKALYEMLRTAPKHKGAENLLAWIKKEIKKYKELIREEKRRKKSRSGVKKIGDIVISVVGCENVGKSYFLKKLTNINIDIGDVPFLTKEPVVAVKNYEGVLYQFVEIPATFENKFLSIISISDIITIVLTPENTKHQLERIQEFLGRLNIIVDKEFTKRNLVIVNKSSEEKEVNGVLFVKDFSEDVIKDILEGILKKLNLIRVYPIKSERAVVLKKGSTVRDFIEKVNENWLDVFRYAKVIRNGKTIRVGLNYELEDKDIVEVKTK